MALIAAEQLGKTYLDDGVSTTALHSATFTVEAGEFVAVMGPSGSGKSTLLHILGCLDRPTTGRYALAGRDMATLTDSQLAQLRNATIGFVFQAFHLLARTSVLDNVLLPLKYSSVSASEHRARALDAIEHVGLSHRLSHIPSQLSGGEKQRVAIARAIVLAPQLILADEPTGNLDTASGKIVMDLLDALHEQSHTVIVITHETATAAYAQRILTMSDGRLVADQAAASPTHEQYQK